MIPLHTTRSRIRPQVPMLPVIIHRRTIEIATEPIASVPIRHFERVIERGLRCREGNRMPSTALRAEWIDVVPFVLGVGLADADLGGC